MAQLREKIRIMVRNDFVSRLLAEAEDDKKDEKVYRHSNYEIPWNDLDTDKELDYKNIWQDLVNHKDLKVPRTSTKNGFVRWFLKMYIIPANSSLKLDREDVNEVHTIYTNSKNADEFVEKVNQHRWIFDKSTGYFILFISILLLATSIKSIFNLSDNLMRYKKTSAISSFTLSMFFNDKFSILLSSSFNH